MDAQYPVDCGTLHDIQTGEKLADVSAFRLKKTTLGSKEYATTILAHTTSGDVMSWMLEQRTLELRYSAWGRRYRVVGTFDDESGLFSGQHEAM